MAVDTGVLFKASQLLLLDSAGKVRWGKQYCEFVAHLLASDGCQCHCALQGISAVSTGLCCDKEGEGTDFLEKDTASAPPMLQAVMWWLQLDFSIATVLSGATVGAKLHLRPLSYPMPLPVLIQICAPSDVPMHRSLRHVCVLSRRSFV